MSSDSELALGPMLVLRWRTLLLGAVLGVASGAVYATLAPKWYEATLTVVQSQHGQNAAEMSIAAKMPIALDAFTTDVQRIRAVLVSNSVSDEIIDKFKLGERYGSEYREQTRKELWQHCNADVDRRSGVVTLTCEDKDPKLAQAMAADFGEVGNRVFGRVSVSSAREERKFLESQVEVARKDVEDSSRKLREFQEKYKIIDLPEQSKAVISAMASIKGEMISKQLELSYLSSFSSRGEASVVQLQQQISILDGKLAQLEATERDAAVPVASKGSGAGSGSAEFFPGAMAVPELRFELEGLLREQKIRETVFALMTQRYEMAKVDEARDTSTFQILDHPTLPTTYARPRRRKMGLLGLFGGVAVACAFIVLPVWWRRYAVTARASKS